MSVLAKARVTQDLSTTIDENGHNDSIGAVIHDNDSAPNI